MQQQIESILNWKAVSPYKIIIPEPWGLAIGQVIIFNKAQKEK